MSLRDELRHDMRHAGLRTDDAALAADVALRRLRSQRDALIVQARASGRSMREIAALFGISHVLVIRVVTRANGGLPRSGGKVRAERQAGECRGVAGAE